MNELRSNINPKLNSNKDLIFQCLEWIGTNELKQIPSSKYKKYQHVVKLYGVTKDGYSVSVNNNEFKPYFFIKVASSFTNLHNNLILLKLHLKIQWL